jgi:hypothetical protein
MNRALIPVFIVLALLMAAIAAAGEPARCAAGAACDDRALPGAAPARPRPLSPTPPAAEAPVPVGGALAEGADSRSVGGLGRASRAPHVDQDGPSLLGALARLVGAVLVLAAVMVACVLGYRKLVERLGGAGGVPPGTGTRRGMLAWATGWADDAGADAVRVASRRYLGGRESIAVIHAGGERFLVGITASQVSLLARLETPELDVPADFTDALTRATPPPAEPLDAADHLRAAVERSRERLGRLAHLAVVPREPRG